LRRDNGEEVREEARVEGLETMPRFVAEHGDAAHRELARPVLPTRRGREAEEKIDARLVVLGAARCVRLQHGAQAAQRVLRLLAASELQQRVERSREARRAKDGVLPRAEYSDEFAQLRSQRGLGHHRDQDRIAHCADHRRAVDRFN
jgi:hypothetical protein